MAGFAIVDREMENVVVGLCTLELYLGKASSLKDKRRILKSILDRVKARYNVSIAEVGQHELWQRATVAFACVTSDQGRAYQVLNSVVKFIESQSHAQITDYRTEII